MRHTRSPLPGTKGFVYLLHYSAPTSEGRRHYLGWSTDVNRRFAEHRRGRGARDTRKAFAEGLAITLAQHWRGDPELEAALKLWSRRGRKGFAGLCPFCPATAELPDQLAQRLGAPSLARRFVPVDPPAPLAASAGTSGSASPSRDL